MAGNKGLNAAAKAKQDEFYTQLTDIEKELRYYRNHFKNKTVFCNCDDPFESNFFKYFVLNFNKLGLKKLIATSYVGSSIAGNQLKYHADKDGQMTFSFESDDLISDKRPYKAVVTTVYDKTGNDAVEMLDVAELFESGENKLVELKGDGDFRSDECIELLKEADIVVTNPPFSLFREYVAQLMEYNKKFIIIGNLNAVKYRDMFPLLKDNKVWLGATCFNGGAAYFIGRPELYEESKMSNPKNAFMKDGKFYWRVNGVRWFTNLDIKKRHEELILVKKYNEDNYPRYDNYDAIEVSKVADIPYDYNGAMGVPISFVDKYNPDQFEILGVTDRENSSGLMTKKYTAEDAPNYNDLNRQSVLKINGEYKLLYTRILLRLKKG